MFVRIVLMMLVLLSGGPLTQAMALEAQKQFAPLLDRLVAAYPDHLDRHDGRYLYWKDGTKMAFDDGQTGKSYKQLLNAPDLQDQFYTPYQAGRAGLAPDLNIDPGRVRYEPFFKKMYGDCRKGEIAKRLRSIKWLPRHRGGRLRVTTVNGVAARLEAISRDLDSLLDRKPKLIAFVRPPSGGYVCRVIAGTKRYSAHSYGAAVDIVAKRGHYWRWSKPGKNGRYAWRNAIPLEIVEIFERHGFIWGGKWYHYDTMHFEYRPELLALTGK
jgi:hypothetical protein